MEDKTSVNSEFCVIYNSDNFDQIVNAITRFLKSYKSNIELRIQKFSHKGKNMIIQCSYNPFETKKMQKTIELLENDLLVINSDSSLEPIYVVPKEKYKRIDSSLQENTDKK